VEVPRKKRYSGRDGDKQVPFKQTERGDIQTKIKTVLVPTSSKKATAKETKSIRKGGGTKTQTNASTARVLLRKAV